MDLVSKEKLTCDAYIYIDKVTDSLNLGSIMLSRIFSRLAKYVDEQGIELADSFVDVNSDVKRQELVTKLTTDSNKPDFILVYGDSHGLNQFGIQVIDVCKIRMMSHEKS